MKRLISLLLIPALLLVLCAGFGIASAAEATVTYPIPGGVKLSYAASPSSHVTAISEWKDTPFAAAWQEQTGVTLELLYVEDFSLLLASGDYPDIINYGWSSYPGGADKAVQDGIIVPITDYLATHAPDYKAALDSREMWSKPATTPAGDIVAFYNLRSEPALNSYGLIIREDWLNTLGLAAPATLDELHGALVAFKEQMGATAPFSMTLNDLRNIGRFGLLTSPFGLVSAGYYNVDGKVHFGAFEPEYKDYLTFLNQLYQDGLLDANILTVDSTTVASNIMNGISGLTAGYASGGMGVWLTNMKSVDPNYALAGVGSVVANAGDRAMYGQSQDPLSSGAAITSACKNVEAAVQFLNYGYSEQGNLLMYYGIEGISFEFVDGYPYYTDFVKNNPDGLPFAQALSQYDYSPANGPFISNGDYSAQTYNEAQLNALNVWRDNDVFEHYIPTLTVSTDASEEYAFINSEVTTYINENFAQFVTGGRSLDEFDAYLDTLRSMNMERMIELYQAAFDEYNAR